jgi:hypothetical protein
MNAAKRGELLRERLKTKRPVGLFCAVTGQSHTKKRGGGELARNRGFYLSYDAYSLFAHRPQWMKSPEPVVEVVAPKVKRRNGVPPLVKMAERLLEKLPVVPKEEFLLRKQQFAKNPKPRRQAFKNL